MLAVFMDATVVCCAQPYTPVTWPQRKPFLRGRFLQAENAAYFRSN